MKHEQYVLVEFDKAPPYIAVFKSDSEITMHKVLEHFQNTNEGFDEERDSLTFLDEEEDFEIITI